MSSMESMRVLPGVKCRGKGSANGAVASMFGGGVLLRLFGALDGAAELFFVGEKLGRRAGGEVEAFLGVAGAQRDLDAMALGRVVLAEPERGDLDELFAG